MRKHIVCLGDSNTHGHCADPEDCADGTLGRFNEEERWPCLLQQALGEGHLVLEEGLSGRTTVFDDPVYEGISALDYLYPCLKSHQPVSLLVIMLGTNDTKSRLGANAHAIGMGMARLVRKAQTTDCWGGGRPNILIVSPPPMDVAVEQGICGQEMGLGAAEKSAQLATQYQAVAEELGCGFFDGSGCALSDLDHMHLTRQGHSDLAKRMAALVRALV